MAYPEHDAWDVAPAIEAAAISYDPANDIPPADRDSGPASLSEIINDDIPF
jgi:hypothetical protein